MFDPNVITIYGGSFDPLHFGHEEIIKKLNKIYNKTIIVPRYSKDLKDCELSIDHRISLINRFIDESDDIDKSKVFVSNVEKAISHKYDKQIVIMHDIINYFIKKYKTTQFNIAIGKDIFTHIHKWKNFENYKHCIQSLLVLSHDFNDIDLNTPYLKDVNIDCIKIKEFSVGDKKLSSSWLKETISNNDQIYFDKFLFKHLRKSIFDDYYMQYNSYKIEDIEFKKGHIYKGTVLTKHYIESDIMEHECFEKIIKHDNMLFTPSITFSGEIMLSTINEPHWKVRVSKYTKNHMNIHDVTHEILKDISRDVLYDIVKGTENSPNIEDEKEIINFKHKIWTHGFTEDEKEKIFNMFKTMGFRWVNETDEYDDFSGLFIEGSYLVKIWAYDREEFNAHDELKEITIEQIEYNYNSYLLKNGHKIYDLKSGFYEGIIINDKGVEIGNHKIFVEKDHILTTMYKKCFYIFNDKNQIIFQDCDGENDGDLYTIYQPTKQILVKEVKL